MMLTLNGHIKTAEQRTIYSIGTLAVDGLAVTFGTARTGCGPVYPLIAVLNVTAHPSTPVYQLHIILCGTIITGAHERVKLCSYKSYKPATLRCT